jgi:hypothetical protein
MVAAVFIGCANPSDAPVSGTPTRTASECSKQAPGPVSSAELTAEQKERLRYLGYVAP